MSRKSVVVTLCLFCIAAWPGTLTAQVLASGQFDLEASSGPGDPAFNSALTANHAMPMGLGATSGVEISVGLRDVGRPDLVCDPDGGLFQDCAAVDWPFPGRRGINLVEVETTSGFVTLHLRMTDTLEADPEPDGP